MRITSKRGVKFWGLPPRPAPKLPPKFVNLGVSEVEEEREGSFRWWGIPLRRKAISLPPFFRKPEFSEDVEEQSGVFWRLPSRTVPKFPPKFANFGGGEVDEEVGSGAFWSIPRSSFIPKPLLCHPLKLTVNVTKKMITITTIQKNLIVRETCS